MKTWLAILFIMFSLTLAYGYEYNILGTTATTTTGNSSGNASQWSLYPALQNVNMANWGLMSLGASNITGDLNFLGGTMRFYTGAGFLLGQMSAQGGATRFIGLNGGSFGIDADNDTTIYINDLRTTANFAVEYLNDNALFINGTNGNAQFKNNVSADCITTTEYITFDDSAAAPSGYLPSQGGAVLSMARGFPVRYDMEIRSIYASNGNVINCVGSDSITNNSCKFQPEFNISGTAFIYGNITLVNEWNKLTITSINLSKGDGILIRMYGSTAGNSSSFVWSNSLFMLEAKKRC